MSTKKFDKYQCKETPDIRELTLANGLSFPSDDELLMLILGKGTQSMPVEKLARECLKVINGSSLENIVEELKKISGMGEAKALVLGAALELGRRRNGMLRSVIKSPKQIVPYLKHITLEPTERFVCVSTNGANEIIKMRTISIGTTNRTFVHPREVLSGPISDHAAGIICCHNHPYGPCLPSYADLETTEVLIKASALMGISFLDHLILTREESYSFLENNLLDIDEIERRCKLAKSFQLDEDQEELGSH